MRRVVVSPAAGADLAEIWLYSAKSFGRRQADVYVGKLRSDIQDLANGHRTGRSCDDVREGYCRANCQSHVIFYQDEADELSVRRILHASMDFRRHL